MTKKCINKKCIFSVLGVIFLAVAAWYFFSPSISQEDPKHLDDNESSRKCVQCVYGDFLETEWLMVAPAEGQEMEWKGAWSGTNCADGNFNTINACKSTCITIHVEEMVDEGSRSHGYLKDCADDLILSSSDIPEGAGKIIPDNRDIVYTAERHRYKVTYMFTTNNENWNNGVVLEQDENWDGTMVLEQTERWNDTKVVEQNKSWNDTKAVKQSESWNDGVIFEQDKRFNVIMALEKNGSLNDTNALKLNKGLNDTDFAILRSLHPSLADMASSTYYMWIAAFISLSVIMIALLIYCCRREKRPKREFPQMGGTQRTWNKDKKEEEMNQSSESSNVPNIAQIEELARQ